MTDADFDAQVRAAIDRVGSLRDRAGSADGPSARAVLQEAVEELAVALEELNVAQEELRAQNEQLACSQAAAVAERDRYRDLFEFAPVGYLVTDADGTLLEVNRAARALLHVPAPRHAAGRPVAAFVHPDDRAGLDAQLAALLRGEPAWDRTLRFVPQGEPAGVLVVDVSVVPFRDVETGRPRLRWQLVDVTERHHAAEALRRANDSLEGRVRERTAELERTLAEIERLVGELRDADRKKDEFVAVLAHELRNPLAPIANALEIMRLAGGDPEPTRRAREMIDRQAAKLNRLVDDLLDVTRIAQGRMHLSPELLDLGEAVARAADDARARGKAAGVKVTLDPAAERLLVRADPARLDQVLANLLTNAVKYTDRGGSVAVAVGRDGDRAVVRVRDTGVGIAPDVLPHVFELFVQADEASGRSAGGLGIGLHLVKQLVDLHAGAVSAASDGPGTGSEFVIRLPLAQPGR